MMRRVFFVVGFILVAGLLGGCNSGPRVANPAIDDITWSGGGKTWGDIIRFHANGTYERREWTLRSHEEKGGRWEVVSAEKQLVVLDGKLPLRLIHNDPPYAEWDFRWRYVAKVPPEGWGVWVEKQEMPKRILPDQDKDISYLLRP